MAKKKQEEQPKNLRYTVKCFKCKSKWEAKEFTACEKCGNDVLYADDHRRLTSRRYVKGIEVAK